MLSSFQDKIIKKVDEIGGDNDNSYGPSNSSTKQKNPFGVPSMLEDGFAGVEPNDKCWKIGHFPIR